MQTSDLTLADGVPLAHPLAARVAQEQDCRALFIKGPVAEAFGLRAPRVSSDVDVWTAPADCDRFIAGLESIGWRRRKLVASPRILTMHSTTMLHDRWPCDIDVHHMFPGMLADPVATFDAMWSHRTTVEVAGAPVPTCGRLGTAAIIALHALRDMQVHRNQVEFDYLVHALQGSLSPSDRSRLAEIARVCGAAQTLAPLLEALDITPPAPPTTQSYRRQWLDWELRRQDNSGTNRWIQNVRRAPWRHRPRELWNAVFLPEAMFRTLHPDVGPSRADLWRARLARFGRGAAALPRATRTAWKVYHDHESTPSGRGRP